MQNHYLQFVAVVHITFICCIILLISRKELYMQCNTISKYLCVLDFIHPNINIIQQIKILCKPIKPANLDNMICTQNIQLALSWVKTYPRPEQPLNCPA